MISPISAPKVLLEGPSGSGKTYALRTLVECGITPFIVALDVQGLEAIADVPAEKLHWQAIRPENKTWESMIQDSKRLAGMTFEGITGAYDAYKHKQQRFLKVLGALSNFKDDRTGKEFGPIDSWPTSRAIVIDHLTELSMATKEWAVGEKLVLHQGEWQVAQNCLENLIRQLTIVPRCWVILISHVDREVDEVRGGTKIMPHTLGRKLAPKLPALFSDVILVQREVKEFRWCTAAPDVDLKTRNLPIETKLAPSFVAICEAWKKRGGIVEEDK